MKGKVVERSRLDARTGRAMYDLFARQFRNVPWEQFLADLDEKNWVLLLHDEAGALRGFSSLHVYDRTIDNHERTIVYSGDTVVDKQAWRDSALSYCWMGTIDYLRRLYGRDKLYWFLLVSGYRTYRFLPVYSRVFYPRYDKPTPVGIQSTIDCLARERFGDRYDAQTGIVRLAVPPVLADGFRGIPGNRLGDPHIRFFAERNPGHERGDELVCFSTLIEEDLTPIGRRMWARGRRLFGDVTT